MGRSTIRVIIILATFSVLGILFIQFFFLKNTVDINEKKFHESATQALKNVAQRLIDYNVETKGYLSTQDLSSSVDQISNNYYVVNVNDEISPTLLGHFLVTEFSRSNLNFEFEYAIYDCESNKMVYGTALQEKDDSLNYENSSLTEGSGCTSEDVFFENHYQQTSTGSYKNYMPTCDKYTYYFGVTFLDRSQYYTSEIQRWYWVNGFMLIVILFFGYTLYVIFKQRRLSEIQKNFINNLTHEFKTPIAAIDLSAKVLGDPKIINHPKRLEEYSKIISEQTLRLSSQVEKVLQMASIQKQKIQLEKEQLDLSVFIKKCIADFKASQNGNGYLIEFIPPPDTIFIEADQLHFSNIIFNILDNAFKYCDEIPNVKISITKKGKRIQINFADNGIGIAKEYRKKIFGKFFRVPTGDIHNVKGFGLGLDYVKKIISRHGWNIDVSENSLKGSIFTITIPK